MDVSQYLSMFIEEAKEHLQTLNEQLLILEKEPDNNEAINEIFRAAHSLKGMAGTMGYKKMQRLTHEMEDVFSEIRDGKIQVNADLVDLLFQCLDELSKYLDNIIATSDEGSESNEQLPELLSAFVKNAGAPAASVKQSAVPVATATATMEAVNSEEKFRTLKIADHEKKAINKAYELGKHVYGMTVHISESCILKAARAFLVFKTLEEYGDVIKSSPEVQEIEDERFDFDFSVFFVTEESEEKIKKVVLNVSEIQSVDIGVIENIKTEEDTEKEEKATETVKKESSSNAKSAPKQNSVGGKQVVKQSVRVDVEKLDNLMNSVSELIIAKNGLASISATEVELQNRTEFNEQIEYLERITTELHQSVMKVRMVPIESVVNKFPRMIRDLSKKLNKKMELQMTGEDTELDRTVVDQIGDPLQHLLRNSADHGLENNEARVAAGKPEVGTIFLNAYQEGNNVVIEVGDDGGGINIEKVKNKAIEKGLITEEQAENMTDKDAVDLLFKPGFSTADTISDVSGRGVGLDVVKTNIEALGGDIEAHTKKGEGSTFIIRLPLTLAIIQALMVELGTEKYAIPLGCIQTIEDIAVSDIMYVQSKQVINLRGTVIPLLDLNEMLDVTKPEGTPESITVVIVRKGDRLAGLIVDNLIGQLEIVIKSIGKYINNSKMISGATILGDGEIALILDVNSMM